jgi:hypothetical protein
VCNIGLSDSGWPAHLHSPDRLAKTWTATVYAFFHPPTIHVESGRQYVEFRCMGKGCRHKRRRYLDTRDVSSTSNLRDHVKKCSAWGTGNEILKEVDALKTLPDAQKVVATYSRSGDISSAFALQGKKVTYSHKQHTKSQAK